MFANIIVLALLASPIVAVPAFLDDRSIIDSLPSTLELDVRMPDALQDRMPGIPEEQMPGMLEDRMPGTLEERTPGMLDERTTWHCTYPMTYNITNKTEVSAAPELITGIYVDGQGSIAAGYSYSRSSSFTTSIGASMELTKIFAMSAQASFGITWTHGTSVTASVLCPANVRCGITASPLMLKITGFQTINLCGSGNSGDKTFPCTDAHPPWCTKEVFGAVAGTPYPFEAWYPLVTDSSIVDGSDLKAVTYAACAVGRSDPADGLDPCPDITGTGSASS